MLHEETKRKINAARDILVGKIPVPMSQIEQITLAMTYKFMSDIDEDNKLLWWKTFFEWDFEKYAWKNLMDKRLWAQERMNIYSEGLDSMSKNWNIPELFRDIFRNAYLPFKDPQTLDRFLKQINEFSYDHSEELGNAFEYLLSTAWSQWDAGQFRTPRHIIDFLVSIVEPTKDDTILDPACGTAWFLISAYKHILNQNTIKIPWDKLSREEKEKLSKNIAWYDISHDMVRLSLVNLYLHGFADPKISEYDTLSSDDKWNEDFNCILANPPFMTPKWWIQPHSRFSIKASKSEVLFVDYIMEHLTLNWKAWIIIPEWIIFQSANAYKELRKNMIENNFLWWVVSLPSGIFQPYSWVKTSILLFDKQIAKKTDKIIFVKVEQDWYDLGAQRREINKNDLPNALELLLNYKKSILSETEFENASKNVLIIENSKIKESWDYNLSGERYRESTSLQNSDFEMVKITDYVVFQEWPWILSKEFVINDWYPIVNVRNVQDWYVDTNITKFVSMESVNWKWNHFKVNEWDILFTTSWTIWRCWIVKNYNLPLLLNTSVVRFNSLDKNKLNQKYLYWILKSDYFVNKLKEQQTWIAISNVGPSHIKTLKIPLPPLEVQEQIVEELDNYQKIIDGAKQIVENYKPKIKINESWEVVELGEVCDVRDWTHDSPKYVENGIPLITSKNLKNWWIDFDNVNYISDIDHDKISKRSWVDDWDVLFAMIWTIWNPIIVRKDRDFSIKNVALFKFNWNQKLLNTFLCVLLDSEYTKNNLIVKSRGWTQNFISLWDIRNFQIPLPPLEIQEKIVAKIEEEQKMVESAKWLIEIFEGKINKRIGEVWGEKSLDGNI